MSLLSRILGRTIDALETLRNRIDPPAIETATRGDYSLTLFFRESERPEAEARLQRELARQFNAARNRGLIRY